MTLSPSEIFNMAKSGNSVVIEKYLAVRYYKSHDRVRVEYIYNQNTPNSKHRSIVVHNPLAMMQAIAILRKELYDFIAEETKSFLAEEQAKATAKYLADQRSNLARIHRDREAMEQQRAENALRYVSGPIKAILERVKPVVDPFAYRNVYGRPAEVFIF